MNNNWPLLDYEQNKETYATFQLWTQILGKMKVATLPWINHGWNVTLKVTPTGLSTLTQPFDGRFFQADLNLVDHEVKIVVSDGREKSFPLTDGLSVSAFYKKIFALLDKLNIHIKIHGSPNEVETPVPFEEDETHHHYHAGEVANFHRALLRVHEVFSVFRAKFRGKCSPVHYFWGASDLAVSRFSGREAPLHPGGVPNLPDRIAQEAYSREVCSAGFWPGNESYPQAAFYSYIYPEPDGFKEAKVFPPEAFYHPDLREFILPYDAVRSANDPEKKLLDFLNSTYDAGADLAKWNRKELEDI